MSRIYHLLYWMLAIVCLSACSDENPFSTANGTLYDEEVTALLQISHQPADDVKVTTRSTLGEVPETRVLNMFVYIFVNGKRIYSHYFNKGNMKPSADEVTQSGENCWYMRNTTTAGTPSQGTAKICIPRFEGGTLYIISNIDADMVNISPERLNLIQTEDEMNDLTASLNQETVSRNGYFPMVAVVENIKVGNDNLIVYEGNNASVTALLERMDAKIQVYVRAAAGETSTEEEEVTTVKEFVPESWRVVHIPKGAYVVPRPIAVETDYATADYNEAGYFSTTTTHFETSEKDTEYNTNKHGFSFYMLENREYRKNPVNGNYHQRDLRIKNSDGSYNTENGLWQNAPEQGTYLEIKGDVVMEVDVSSQAGTQQLTANVTYYIHLGDLTAGMDNYNIERNTTYTYTITIHGADKIELEVATSQPDSETEFTEAESGAAGMVYISREYTYTFDAHYGQRVFCFDAEYIEPEQVTWYVKTPFGNEGIPPKVNGVEIPAGYDYKWVEFMLNPLQGNGTYSQLNQAYPGYKNRTGGEEGLNVGDTGHLMDVVEFTEWIKQEKLKYDRGEENAFVEEEDAEWKAKFPDEPTKYMRHRLYATIFVNEYYYEEHPITGVKDNLLWKQFVNQPNRLMHILCDSRHSLDGESSYTGSIITIRQRSIQTPYNINKGTLQSGWGCETVDETRDMNLSFYEDDSKYTKTDFGNDARNNGLYNTACLWNLITLTGNNGSKTPTGYNSSQNWSTYLDYARENDHNIIFMKEDLDCHRYSAMMRNRDNNGNGTIDPEEVRWYIASLQQLYGLYIGGLGLSDEAQLYPKSIATQPNERDSNNKWKWRNHIICSTQTSVTESSQRGSEYFPDYLWAEEGVSVAGYRQEWQKQALMSIRCVRNLGLDNPTTENIWDKTQNIPTDLISFEEDGKVCRFNLSNVNEKSLRDYSTTKELEPYDENNETSRPYQGFITSEAFITSNVPNYNTIKTNLESGGSYGTDGYRLPNVREAALMSLYCSSTWWNGKIIHSSSYYSHGSLGSKYDNATTSWGFQYNYIGLNSSQNALRFVKDYMPTE